MTDVFSSPVYSLYVKLCGKSLILYLFYGLLFQSIDLLVNNPVELNSYVQTFLNTKTKISSISLPMFCWEYRIETGLKKPTKHHTHQF